MTEEKDIGLSQKEIVGGDAKENKPLILVADDQLVNRELFALILEKLNYPSLFADDGLDALEKSKGSEAALVFMDLQMPRMNGFEAAENLRKRGFKNPVIAVTASADSDAKKRCLEAGIDDVLSKPFKQADVEKMLLKWIGVNRDSLGIGHDPAHGIVTETAAEKAEEKSAGSAPAVVFDIPGVLDTFLNNNELLLSLLSRFTERTQRQLDNILVLINAESWEEAMIEAHVIKGASYTLGGMELGQIAGRLELAFKNVDRGEIDAAYPPALEAFIRFKKEAEDFLRARS